MTLPIPDSYRVADRFLAGAYPGSADVDEAARRLGRFEEHGVTLYVDLTHPADSLAAYAPLVGPSARRSAHAIVDMGVTTIPHMSRILDEVDEALATRRHRLRALLGRDRPHRNRRRLLVATARARPWRCARADRRAAPRGLRRSRCVA